MGHTRLVRLPRTRRWQQVVSLVRGGADAPQATATINAAGDAITRAARDRGVAEAVFLLTQLVAGACAADFARYLRQVGVVVPDAPTLTDVVAGVSEAIDAAFACNRGRTDITEMAQAAAPETLFATVGPGWTSLFAADPGDVKPALAGLHTPARFGALACLYFAQLGDKCLDSFVSRAVPNELGGGRRFTTLDQERRFTRALLLHCHQAAAIAERFPAEWCSKLY